MTSLHKDQKSDKETQRDILTSHIYIKKQSDSSRYFYVGIEKFKKQQKLK